MKRLLTYCVLLLLGSCQQKMINDGVIQQYVNNSYSLFDNPIVIIPTGNRTFTYMDYHTLKDFIYIDYYSEEYDSFEAFLCKCLSGKEIISSRLPLKSYRNNYHLLKESSTDFSSFLEDYLVKEGEFSYITNEKLFDPTVLLILFNKGYKIYQDDYRGVYVIIWQ